MGHGWYNVVQPMGHRMVRVLYGLWVMGGTTLYSPWVMESYIVVQRCITHGSWGGESFVWPMGHGWYNVVQPIGHGVVRALYGPWVMGGTTLYNP